jgi:hypothetical protein
MSELGELQRKFPLMRAKLTIFAYDAGYELTDGEGFDDDGTGHMKGSCHYVKLAQDFNLFKDGVYLDKGPAMEEGHGLLHDYWDSIGGAPRIAKDLNHYSLLFQGRR